MLKHISDKGFIAIRNGSYQGQVELIYTHTGTFDYSSLCFVYPTTVTRPDNGETVSAEPCYAIQSLYQKSKLAKNTESLLNKAIQEYRKESGDNSNDVPLMFIVEHLLNVGFVRSDEYSEIEKVFGQAVVKYRLNESDKGNHNAVDVKAKSADLAKKYAHMKLGKLTPEATAKAIADKQKLIDEAQKRENAKVGK